MPLSAAVALVAAALLGCGEERAPGRGAGNAGGAGTAPAEAGAGGGAGSAGTAVSAGGTGGMAGTGAPPVGGQGGAGSAAPHDAGAAGEGDSDPLDAGGLPQSAVRRIAAPPSYRGSVDNGAACSRDYATTGFEPDAPPGTRHPLLLHFTGTNFTLDAAAFRAQITPAAEAVTEAFARRGFVALQVEYDNSGLAWASDHTGLLGCLFGAGNPASVVAVACALPNVDCALGIATWGHSLGGFVAHAAASLEPRVRAAWTTGYGGDAQSTLPQTRLRVVNAENDTTNGLPATLNAIAGFDAAECPDDGRSECLREDGSGWILVRRVDCQTSSADHCWFDRTSCLDTTTMLEPNWIDPASTKAFALEANADWLAAAARAR